MKKNIIILYDERSTYTNTVKEHLYSFKNFSRHNIFYAPASNLYWPDGNGYTDEYNFTMPTNGKWDLSAFDVLILHYSVRMSLVEFVACHIADSIRRFQGKKILFIQDEYENVKIARANIDDFGFDTIFTCVPESGLDYVYEAKSKRANIEFLTTLTGFVPYLNDLEPYRLPMEERDILVAYRGRKLPHNYGMLGYDKYIIGERFREETAKRGIKADIETDDNKRIYGSWYEFLGSSRSTLGTESGSNIFDFDGSLKAKAQQLSDRPFMEVYNQHFARHEGVVMMNQISPKFFEAIMLHTALVCFPGDYSGILLKDRHFIQIERDFSNMDEVLGKLNDTEFLNQLTNRAYDDIIAPQKYSYRTFVRHFDEWLDLRVSTSKCEIVSTPIGTMKNGVYEAFGHHSPSDMLFNTTVLADSIDRETFCSLYELKEEETNTWNCARTRDGARITKSSQFFSAPHDAESLLRPYIKGNYAAEMDGNSPPHFIEIDLGTIRPICGFILEWLSHTNISSSIIIKGSKIGFVWKTLYSLSNNYDTKNHIYINKINLRYIRIDVTSFIGQQRILIKKLNILSDIF